MTRHVQLSWLADLVDRSQDGIITQVMEITPDMARDMLAMNDGNRPVTESRVKKYVNELKSGRFVLNGESIIIANDGSLNDGQHRLLACIEAGTAFRSVVVVGVDRETRLTTDTGKGKDRSTLLGMAGVANSRRVAAALTVFIIYDLGLYVPSYDAITAQDLCDFYAQKEALMIKGAHILNSKQSKALAPASLMAAFLILSPLNEAAANEFVHRVIDGAGLPAGHPILLLRAKLMTEKRLRNHERLELILRTWNYWRRGIVMSRSIALIGRFPHELEK